MKKINWYLKERLPEVLSGILAVVLICLTPFLEEKGFGRTVLFLLTLMAVVFCCGYRSAKNYWYPEKKQQKAIEDPTEDAFQCEYDSSYHPHY